MVGEQEAQASLEGHTASLPEGWLVRVHGPWAQEHYCLPHFSGEDNWVTVSRAEMAGPMSDGMDVPPS